MKITEFLGVEIREKNLEQLTAYKKNHFTASLMLFYPLGGGQEGVPATPARDKLQDVP